MSDAPPATATDVPSGQKIPYTGLPTENPNSTIIPGKMRSDREEVPEGFTKEEADLAEVNEAKLLNRNRTSRAAATCQQYWPSFDWVCGAIRDKYNSLGAQGSFLLWPTSGNIVNPGNTGERVTFVNGPIYWSAATGAHPVVNSFLNRWSFHQYETGRLKYPTTDEIVLPDGGRRQEFQQGAIYVAFQNAVGSAIFNGPIRDKWNSVGAQAGPLGYVSSDEISVVKNSGRYNNFVNGTITWSQPTGARLLFGVVRDAWFQAGREDGVYGYPLSDEQVSSDGIGHFVRFESGDYIYATPLTGAWRVPWQIHAVWTVLNGELGAMKYPAALPVHQPKPGIEWRQKFQNGEISYGSNGNAYLRHF